MNIHIMLAGKFTEGFVSFVFENFPFDEHYFFLTGNKQDYKTLEKYQEHICWVKNYIELYQNEVYKKKILGADRVIINGVMGNEFLIPHLGKKLLKKTIFFFWGADIYCLGDKISITNTKSWLKQKIKKYMFANAKAVVTLIPGDYNVLCKYISPKGKHFVGRMECGGVRPVDLIERYRTEEKEEHPYKVIIGNSATASNLHMQAIDWLSKFKGENVEFICPLSYGDKEYGDQVIAYGKEKLGDQFVPLTGFMDRETYYNMLNGCTVGIFNNNRQQAMSNIKALLEFGAKVYIRRDTVMWGQLEQNDMIPHDIEKISQESFEEFVGRTPEEIEQNHQAMLNYYDIKNAIREWSAIFEA